MNQRLANKTVRSADSIMRSLGYELTRAEKGRYRYERDGIGPYVLHGTSSDHRWFANFLADMRRRHPDAAMLQRRKSQVPRSRRLGRKRRLSSKVPLSLVHNVEVEVRPEVERLDSPACVDCGRVWVSDLDYSTRLCPDCGGDVSLIRRSA